MGCVRIHEDNVTQNNISKTTINVLTLMKRKEFYIPPNFFNKFDDRGNILCRVDKCNRQTKLPFKYFLLPVPCKGICQLALSALYMDWCEVGYFQEGRLYMPEVW